MAAATLPQQFGRYRILKKLGQGGMGSVYLAHDTQLERQVALKVPHIESADGPSVLQRFYREARAAATLNHPNLCQVHDVGAHGNIPYLTMAFVEGRTLAERIKEGQPLPQREAADIVRKLALALHEAHARGVIHRDLKPANVMINQRGEPVVMDFGLARLATRNKTKLTQLGSMMGTPSYMSPEQVRGDIGVMGPGCDIYSLGVMLYEMLAGQLPFQGPVEAVLGQILTQAPDPPSMHRRGIDPRLAAICLRAMQKDISQRYANMGDLAAALTEYLHAVPPAVAIAVAAPTVDTVGGARKTVAVVPPAASSRRSAKPFTGLLFAGAAVALLVMLLAVGVIVTATVLYFGYRKPEPPISKQASADLAKSGAVLPAGVPEPPISKQASADPKVAKKAELNLGGGVKLELMRIDPGRFMMGSPGEEVGREPVFTGNELLHKVEITKPYYMGVTTVTQAQYRQVMSENPSWFSAKGKGAGTMAGKNTDEFPVESVSWQDAVTFCNKTTLLPAVAARGWIVDLPTEAEWEYACRAGTQTPFHFGNTLRAGQANFDGNFPYGGAARGQYLGQPFPVRGYDPNAWGLYDMHGNVWQWCKDWYGDGYYQNSPAKDPAGPADGNTRILRGGSWRDVGRNCRSAHRDIFDPTSRADNTGFRVAVRPPP
jgi:formylglycine-generating enzyme required for sulfatase activity